MRRALPAAVLLSVVSCLSVKAQAATRPPVFPTEGPGRIISIVVSEKGAPVASAVIAVRSARDSTPVATEFTNENGKVVVKGLPLGTFLVRVSSIGFKGLDLPAIQLTPSAPTLNLGELKLEIAAIPLTQLEVTAQQAQVVLESDRTIYNTKDMTAAGTAVDFLRAIPELEVAANGKVTMRGGHDVAIYLNGRPAPVTGELLVQYLQQFPGHLIAKVEVIPNPSAKYDPDGMVGIVNIQLKDLMGGNVSVGGTSRFDRTVTARVAHKSDPLTLIGGVTVNSSTSEVDSYDRRENLLSSPVTFVEQRGDIDQDRRRSTFDLFADLALPSNQTLWASATAYLNNTWQTGFAHYDILDEWQALRDRYDRDHSNEGGYHNIDASVGFQKTAGKRELKLQLRRTVGRQSATHRLTRQFFMWEGAPVAWPEELTLGDFSTDNESLRAQADYVRDLKGARLELGYLGYNRSENQDNRLNVEPEAALRATTTSTRAVYRYEETVNALYGALARSFGKVSAQLGLRGEIASMQFDLPLLLELVERDYNSVYPSASVGYNLGEKRTVRVAYSRRVTRPVPTYLNPSVAQLDPLNRTAGNPDIKPMYTNVLTGDLTKSGSRGNLRISPYYSRTTDNWEPIKRVDSAGVSTVSWENSASLTSYGVQVTGTLFLGQKVSNVTAFGLNRDVRDADNLASVYVHDAVRWNVNTNFGVRFNRTLTGQAYLRYTPAYDLVQGRVEGSLYSFASLSQLVASGKGSINLQVVDPFDLQRYKFETRDGSHVQSGRSNYKTRLVSLSFSYNFGSTQEQGRRPAEEPTTGQLPVIR